MTSATARAALAQVQAQRATRNYQQAQALTVTPGQLVILLYEGALKFMRRARQALDERDLEAAHNALCRAQEIVIELDATLDARGGSVTENLHRVYDYCYRQLVQANVAKDPAPVDEIIGHFEQLLEAWRQAVAAVETTGQPGSTGGSVPLQVASIR
jgi:flagellar protein FliS